MSTNASAASSSNTKLWLIALAGFVIGLSALNWMTVAGTDPVSDEPIHYEQIQIFLGGEHYQHPRLVMIPSYHAGLALYGKATGMESLDAMRLVSLLIAMFVPLIVFTMTDDLPPDIRFLRALQVFLIPMLFPVTAWVYTDPSALVFVLAACFATAKRCYFWAGLFAIGATMLRQNSIIWLAMCHGIAFIRETQWQFAIESIKRFVLKTPAFFVGYALFAIFIVVNGGVAMGAQGDHPSFQLYTGNIALAIVIALGLLLPMHLSRLAVIKNTVKHHAVPVLGLALFAATLHYLFFNPSNKWNQINGTLNNALAWVAESPGHRLVSCVAIVLGMLALSGTRFRLQGAWLSFPATCLFLGSSWLITGRYSIAPLAILIVYAKPGPRWAEVATVVLLGVTSLLFFTHGFYL